MNAALLGPMTLWRIDYRAPAAVRHDENFKKLMTVMAAIAALRRLKSRSANPIAGAAD